MVVGFTCICGLHFETMEDVRNHNRVCSQARQGNFTCAHCSHSTHILLPYNGRNVCPSCAVLYEKPTIVLGCSIINHMTKKHEEIFHKKAGALLQALEIENLPDLGVVVAVITFSAQGHQPLFEQTPKGELIFMFSNREVPRREEKDFGYVISHETFHAYISHKLKLEICDSLTKPLTFLEAASGSLAEDVQLTKIAVDKNVRPLIHDESMRVRILYENLPVLPTSAWKTLPDETKFFSMSSVTYTYATELWCEKALKDSLHRKHAQKNMRLVHPHYSRHGNPALAKLIDELYEEKIAETKQEKETMYGKILRFCDEWVESHGLNLY